MEGHGAVHSWAFLRYLGRVWINWFTAVSVSRPRLNNVKSRAGMETRSRLQAASSSDLSKEILERLVARLLAIVAGARMKVGQGRRHEPIRVVVAEPERWVFCSRECSRKTKTKKKL